MSLLHPQASSLAQAYLDPDGIQSALGSGLDGVVYETSRGSAVKVHATDLGYRQELSVYRRLQRNRVEVVSGFHVPSLLGHDDDRRVIEMTIVYPPYVIDFAKSRLDVAPDFEPSVWEEWIESKAEEFGEDWGQAARVFDELKRKYGVIHLDLSPRNFRFTRDQ